MSISEKALLMTLTIGMPPASRKVKPESERLEKEKGTAKNQAAVVAKLFARQDIEPLNKVSGAARRRFRELTIAYGRSSGLVPTVRYFDFMTEIGAFRREFEAERDELLSNFKDALGRAEEVNGGLFDVNNYPDYETLASQMYFSIECTPVPSENDYDRLSNLTPEQIEVLKREAVMTTQSKTQEAMKDLVSRLQKAVHHAAERLQDDPNEGQKIFRDTLLTNIDKALEAVKTLNITDDEALIRLAEEVEGVFKEVTPLDLRTQAEIRSEVASKSAELANRLQELL